MANTTNFGWETPDDTDLVKDGAAAMRTLGNAIDTSFVDLKGGTTGQVLSKASNTDLDFTWVAQDDSNAIQNAIVDAKGDLISATAADTPARLAVGNNGETLVADSSASTGLRWQGNYAAGKNKIINGDFGIWQRGTSFTLSTTQTYTTDRFRGFRDGNGTVTLTRESFTPGSAPVAGYESEYFLQLNHSSAGTTTYYEINQNIEDVRTFAGQTVTISFWARLSTGTVSSPYVRLNQIFGTGGSATVTGTNQVFTPTGSWARYSATVTLPSISGKTVGTNNTLQLQFIIPTGGATSTMQFWGVQVEAGSVATPFTTATGTLAGELAACQRYYYRITNAAGDRLANIGYAQSTSVVRLLSAFPVTMRVKPTALEQSGTAGDYAVAYLTTGAVCTSVPGFINSSTNHAISSFTVASPFTAGQGAEGYAQTANGYLGWSAEL